MNIKWIYSTLNDGLSTSQGFCELMVFLENKLPHLRLQAPGPAQMPMPEEDSVLVFHRRIRWIRKVIQILRHDAGGG